MSIIEDLQHDLKANREKARRVLLDPQISPLQLAKHILEDLWPFLEAQVDHSVEVAEEIASIDDAVKEMVEESGDLLQEETAGEFAVVLLEAGWVESELRKYVGHDPAIVARLDTFAALRTRAGNLLESITIAGEEADDDADEDQDGEDDDEEGEDEGEPS